MLVSQKTTRVAINSLFLLGFTGMTFFSIDRAQSSLTAASPFRHLQGLFSQYCPFRTLLRKWGMGSVWKYARASFGRSFATWRWVMAMTGLFAIFAAAIAFFFFGYALDWHPGFAALASAAVFLVLIFVVSPYLLWKDQGAEITDLKNQIESLTARINEMVTVTKALTVSLVQDWIGQLADGQTLPIRISVTSPNADEGIEVLLVGLSIASDRRVNFNYYQHLSPHEFDGEKRANVNPGASRYFLIGEYSWQNDKPFLRVGGKRNLLDTAKIIVFEVSSRSTPVRRYEVKVSHDAGAFELAFAEVIKAKEGGN